MNKKEEIIGKSLIRMKQELCYASHGKSETYIKLKIEKALSILEVLIDIIKSE